METRLITQASEIRASASESGELRIAGMAAVYETDSNPIPNGKGSFIERIARGAFRSIMRKNPDVVMLLNHDQNKVLGRTTSGTLTLAEDSRGLKFSNLLPNTQTGRDVYELVRRGDLNGMSFAFQVDEDEWSEEKSAMSRAATYAKRVIKSFKNLIDVSLVTTPAYSGTEVFARANVVAAEVRARAESFESLQATIELTPEDCLDNFCKYKGLKRSDYATHGEIDEAIRRRKMLLNSVVI